MTSSLEHETAHEVTPQKLLFWSVAILIAFGWIFWDFIQRQFWFAIQQQADWGHTLVIPCIAGYFVWLSRGKILSEPFKKIVDRVVLSVSRSWLVYALCTWPNRDAPSQLNGIGRCVYNIRNMFILIWVATHVIFMVPIVVFVCFWSNNF